MVHPDIPKLDERLRQSYGENHFKKPSTKKSRKSKKSKSNEDDKSPKHGSDSKTRSKSKSAKK